MKKNEYQTPQTEMECIGLNIGVMLNDSNSMSQP